MVKKLFKHEFLYYARIMSVVYLILFTVATAGRVIQFFESDSIPYKIVFDISCTTYGISVVAALAFSSVLGIIRFYRNLFTAEGYLSFTLPVTAAQHILVKAVTAVCVTLFTLLMILISGCIITAGELLLEIWKALVYLLQKLVEHTGAHGIIIAGEFTVLFVVGLFSSILLYYTFIAIGQLFRKNRILAAVGAYFVYYIASQVISTVLAVALSVIAAVGVLDGFMLWLSNTAQQQPYTLIHSIIWFVVLLSVIFTLIEFFITRRIITRKLNLE